MIDNLCRTSVRMTRFVFLLLCLFATLLAQAQVGNMRGKVYEDLNQNGHQDVGEPGIPGLSMLQTSLAGTRMATTNDAGVYSFPDTAPGHYFVSMPISSRYEPSTAGGSLTQEVNYVGDDGTGDPGGPDFPVLEKCLEFKDEKILCNLQPPGTYQYTFTVTNVASFPISHLYFLNGAPVVFQSNLTGSPNYIPVNPPLPPGQSQTFTVTVSGLQPGQFCFEMSAHDKTLAKCCFARHCVDFPRCDCLQFLEESVTCDPAGNYQWCFTVQNLTQQVVHFITIAPPLGVTISPVVIPVNAPNGIPYGGTYSGCVTISGALPNSQICFEFGLHDRYFKACCAVTKCIQIPQCGCDLTPGECCALKPHYNDSAWGPFTGTVAAVTCGAYNPGDPVLALQNLDNYQCNPPATLGVHWPTVPLGYHGPQDSWNLGHLGTIFGLTIDNRGNIYVAASSCYGFDSFPNGGGTVYVIANGTGAVSTFVNNLPNTLDTTFGTPGLGNITFDCDHDQFFVTNHDDGKIYRLKRTGNPLVGTWGASDVYDPFTADNGAAGFAPLGERLWGIQWHNNRVYFSRWVENMGTDANPTADNEVWSVALDGAGDIMPASLRLEVTVPPLAGQNYSHPVSDISFSPEGKMMLCERSMSNATGPYAHQSRALEYDCGPDGKWANTGGPNQFVIGAIGINGPSCAGGVDYDYSAVNCGPGTGRRVWFTADYAGYFPGGGVAYGIQGTPIAGGTYLQSIIQDVTGVADGGKTQIGDIEIHCPIQPIIAGRVHLGDWSTTPAGKTMDIEIRAAGTSAVVQTAQVTLDANGAFTLPLDATLVGGSYDIGAKGKCWLRQRVVADVVSERSVVNFSLTNGDVNGDNYVGTDDYLLLSAAFDTVMGDPAYLPTADLNGDGVINTDDYLILSEHFDTYGH